MLLKVTALVMLPVLPFSATLATVFGTVKLARLTAPLKLTVPPMFCRAKLPKPLTVVPLTSAPLMALPVCKVKVYEPKVTAPKVMSPALVVALLFNVVFAPKVTGPKTMAALVLLMVPFKVLALGAVAVKPPV